MAFVHLSTYLERLTRIARSVVFGTELSIVACLSSWWSQIAAALVDEGRVAVARQQANSIGQAREKERYDRRSQEDVEQGQNDCEPIVERPEFGK
jgi:uncharacterized membrane protein